MSVKWRQSKNKHQGISALDLLDALPGKRLFKTPEEADQYLQEERSAWEN